MAVYEMRYYDLAGVSGVSVMDELEALYLKGMQRRQQNPEFKDNPDVWVWASAMWPEQPRQDRMWVPGVQLGYVLASPPEKPNRIGQGQRKIPDRLRRLESDGPRAIDRPHS